MDINSITPDAAIDVRGMPCPMPGLMTAKAMMKMKDGEVIEVTANNSFFKKVVPSLIRKTGNELLGSVNGDDSLYRFYLRKG
jgi:tRNA 2-thiouridine synthesizing protein A